MAGFALNDALMKLAFEDLPLGQSIAVRGLVATIILGFIAWRSGAFAVTIEKRDRSGIVIRTAAEAGATATFLISISQMPIADATAVLQAAPLAVTLGAAVFLGETVGWRRWSAIGAGFVGVIIMVRPGTDGFTAWSFLPLITVAFIALRDLVTRRFSSRLPSPLAAFVTAASIMVLSAAVVPVEGWRPLTGLHGVILSAAALFIVVGYVFSVSAMRVGDVSAVSPFRYTVLLWAILWGLLVFNEVPDAFTIVGAGIVTSAGLYTLWREQVRGKVPRLPPTRPMDVPE